VGFVRRDALPLSITKEFLAHQCLHRELTIDASRTRRRSERDHVGDRFVTASTTLLHAQRSTDPLAAHSRSRRRTATQS